MHPCVAERPSAEHPSVSWNAHARAHARARARAHACAAQARHDARGTGAAARGDGQERAQLQRGAAPRNSSYVPKMFFPRGMLMSFPGRPCRRRLYTFEPSRRGLSSGAMEYAWNTRGIRVEYAWNTRAIRVEYAWNTRGIRVEYAWNTHGIRVEYAWNTPDTCVYACLHTHVYTHGTGAAARGDGQERAEVQRGAAPRNPNYIRRTYTGP